MHDRSERTMLDESLKCTFQKPLKSMFKNSQRACVATLRHHGKEDRSKEVKGRQRGSLKNRELKKLGIKKIGNCKKKSLTELY